MREVFHIAMAVDLLLTCAEGVCPSCRGYLPLGGSDLAQAGFALSIAFIGVDSVHCVSHLLTRRRSHKR